MKIRNPNGPRVELKSAESSGNRIGQREHLAGCAASFRSRGLEHHRRLEALVELGLSESNDLDCAESRASGEFSISEFSTTYARFEGNARVIRASFVVTPKRRVAQQRARRLGLSYDHSERWAVAGMSAEDPIHFKVGVPFSSAASRNQRQFRDLEHRHSAI
jgi:hypothetical protein